MSNENYLEECITLDVEYLDEAGGILSWIKRSYTATDSNLVTELNLELAHRIKAPEDKTKMLKEIDEFIEEAERSVPDNKLRDFSSGALIGVAMRGHARDSGKIKEYLEKLKRVRARVAAFKVPTKKE